MGERLSGGGVSGRRHGRPGDPWWAEQDGALEALLALALRDTRIDADAEQRAVVAFRAARDAGAHRARARTRRRDDWRPRPHRRAGRSLKATLAVVLGSLTLGGVAVAAIGSAGSTADDADTPRGGPRTSASAPDSGSAGTGAPSTAPAHPPTAQDTEAHCAAYEKVKDSGKALDATAWQRLVTAAGGEKEIDAYCARQTAQATAPTPSRPSRPSTPPRPTAPPKPTATGKSNAPTAPANENAENAESAENADTAENAENAENADISEKADNAENAEISNGKNQ
ncbi:hypothetical protein [Streptomyces sp. NPDC006997]|uniref:hypothetical protein n=1 Tax=Streptomyces sp. NPDC006997 TaxID=3155356 RepID=UPI00340BECD7